METPAEKRKREWQERPPTKEAVRDQATREAIAELLAEGYSAERIRAVFGE